METFEKVAKRYGWEFIGDSWFKSNKIDISDSTLSTIHETYIYPEGDDWYRKDVTILERIAKGKIIRTIFAVSDEQIPSPFLLIENIKFEEELMDEVIQHLNSN